MSTLSLASELTSRRRRSKADVDDAGDLILQTMTGSLLAQLRARLQLAANVQFPSPMYAADPVGYCRYVLGFEPWSKQVEIMLAVRDHTRVAVVSGHKTGKSTSAAAVALWFYCSFPDARVVMSSTTARQVDQILWRELRMLRARSGRCVQCKLDDPGGHIIRVPCKHSALIDGDCGDLARTGLKSADFREIVGFTAREAEAIAGISGSRLLFIVDEASGVPDLIFEAIEGNRAGGATLLLLGNGTRNEGEFFEAFHGKSQHYFSISVSCEETPNATAPDGAILIPGLATRAYVEEKKAEWGEQSAQYIIRVKGGFALGEDSKIFSTHTIVAAEQRWSEVSDAGRLFIGLDPAGATGTGDEIAISARRGLKHLAMAVDRGLNVEQHLGLVLRWIDDLALPRETPVVVIDREGKIGSDLHKRMLEYLEQPEFRHAPPFELVSVKASDGAVRRPHIYDRVRDELTANLEDWVQSGGGVLTDTKLAKELHQPQWFFTRRGKTKCTSKDDIKKAIGRSPDRYDSLALACWEPLSLHAADMTESGKAAVRRQAANDNGFADDVDADTGDNGDSGTDAFDPYAGSDPFHK